MWVIMKFAYNEWHRELSSYETNYIYAICNIVEPNVQERGFQIRIILSLMLK